MATAIKDRLLLSDLQKFGALVLVGASLLFAQHPTAAPGTLAPPSATNSKRFFLGRPGGLASATRTWQPGVDPSCLTTWFQSMHTHLGNSSYSARVHTPDVKLFISSVDTALETNWPHYGQFEENMLDTKAPDVKHCMRGLTPTALRERLLDAMPADASLLLFSFVPRYATARWLDHY
jgi:hypothetical protein